jgi:hypothetical protein
MKKHLFLGSLTAALALFAACGGGEDEIINSVPSPHTGNYSITVNVTDVQGLEGLGSANVITATGRAPAPSANSGDKLILTVVPPVGEPSSDDLGGGGGDPVYYFVAPIKGSYKKNDNPPTEFNGFIHSPAVINEYTFTMPDGDLEVNISFTTDVDKTSALLRWFSASAGSYTKTGDFEYTVIVPHDYNPQEGDEGFVISAQAENQNANLTLQQGYPAGEGDNLFESEEPLTLEEGLNEYTITVIPEDEGSPSKTYHVKVIKLPDLSLSTFQIKNNSDFLRDLPLLDTQPVFVSHNENLQIVATSAAGATVSISPASIPTLSEDTSASTDVTVTVSKTLTGVPEEYRLKRYVLKLYYTATALTPLAAGGYVSFITDDTSGSFYEVHTFTASGTLSFTDTSKSSITADYLIVAGGGGSGGNRINYDDLGGGGGAGGLLYKDAASLSLPGGSVTVTVGTGGAGGAPVGASSNTEGRGTNGGTSSIGAAILVLGGGGGGGGMDSGAGADGADGGSGGGSGAKGADASGAAGKASADNGEVLGNDGGTAGPGSGGGGGGAKGPGGDAAVKAKGTNAPGAGGKGWQPADEGAAWITQITGATIFSSGGTGGAYNGSDGNEAANYGDGGSGHKTKNVAGRKGHDGIVVIRFPHSAPSE